MDRGEIPIEPGDSYNKTNDNLNKSIERIKRKNRYLVSGGAVCAIAFVVCLLVK